MNGWIGVDLDGTLAHYEGWNDGLIGEPIPLMAERVKGWIESGIVVKIVTARVSIPSQAMEQRCAIERWCEEHLGRRLEVTCEKGFDMVTLYDDRAVQVEKNTGRLLGEPQD